MTQLVQAIFENGVFRPLDPVIEVYKRDVDVSLIIENLRLSPQQRLEKLAQMQEFAAELRQAGRACKS